MDLRFSHFSLPCDPLNHNGHRGWSSLQGRKRPGHETHHSLSTTAGVKKTWNYISTPTYEVLNYRHKLTFLPEFHIIRALLIDLSIYYTSFDTEELTLLTLAAANKIMRHQRFDC
jgi:hypothetical protein